MLSIKDLTVGGSVVVPEEGLLRVFSSLFTGSVAGLSLASFGISSVVYFGTEVSEVIGGLQGNTRGLRYKDVVEHIVGMIGVDGDGLTLTAPVFTASQCMESQLTCVLGGVFYEQLQAVNKAIGGCGIVLGGETGYSSNVQNITLGGDVGNEVLLAYEVYDAPLAWSVGAYESTYVHSFAVTLGQK